MQLHDTTPEPTPTKRCTKCDQTKLATLEYFCRSKLGKHGLQSVCKDCRQAYRDANRQRISDYMREYYTLTKQHHVEYRIANQQYIAEKKREYRKAHPEQDRASVRLHRARKVKAEGSHSAADIKRQYQAQRGKCYYCGCKTGGKYHIDHVVPLARGGSDSPENLVIACAPCNQSKGKKLPHEWIKGGRLL